MTEPDGRPGQFLVRRDDLHRCEWFDLGDPAALELGAGEALLAVDSFAMTANNITYAVFGDAMQYWRFFPAHPQRAGQVAPEEGWGTVPVWGFATVARSKAPGVAAGDRYYGYLPMASYFVVKAGQGTPQGFSDHSAHREGLSPFYNQYLRCAGDSGYDAAHEAEQMLFRPLFLTGFLIDDFLADSGFFGATSVLLSSASSKTAIGLAFCLSKREGIDVVGLTSPGNREFVEGLGCYSRVVTYDAIAAMPASERVVFVDMAGDAAVTTAVHTHFGASLRYSCSVGGTHHERLAFGIEVPGPTPTLFFAPGYAAKRLADWGAEGLQSRTSQAWASFLPQVTGWIAVERSRGRAAIERVYLDTLDGRADPKRGHILEL